MVLANNIILSRPFIALNINKVPMQLEMPSVRALPLGEAEKKTKKPDTYSTSCPLQYLVLAPGV